MLTSKQRDLLIQIAVYQQMGDGGDFTLVRSSKAAQLHYANGVSVECTGDDDDFRQLERARLIALSQNSSGQIFGRLTESGKFSVFGIPTGKSYGEDLSLKTVPKGTRTYEELSDAMSLGKEQLAFHYAEILENVPPESAPRHVFVEYTLKAIAGAYDIEAQALLKNSKPTSDTTDACEGILDALAKAYVDRVSTLGMPSVNPVTWRKDVEYRLNARKRYWLGHYLRRIREHHERMNEPAKAYDIPNESASVKQASSSNVQVRNAETIAEVAPRTPTDGNEPYLRPLTGDSPEDSGTSDDPEAVLRETSSTKFALTRRTLIDSFLAACNESSRVRINRAHIWRLVGHSTARQFEYWQAGNDRPAGMTRGATDQDDQNFQRVLAMKPKDFFAQLTEKGLLNLPD